MKYVIDCNSSNEHYNADCDVAVVDITPELARKILVRRKRMLELIAEDEDLNEMCFVDLAAEFCGVVEYPDSLDDPIPLPEDFEYEAQKVEGEELVLTENGLWWRCYPRHADITICTQVLEYSFIEKCAG